MTGAKKEWSNLDHAVAGAVETLAMARAVTLTGHSLSGTRSGVSASGYIGVLGALGGLGG